MAKSAVIRVRNLDTLYEDDISQWFYDVCIPLPERLQDDPLPCSRQVRNWIVSGKWAND